MGEAPPHRAPAPALWPQPRSTSRTASLTLLITPEQTAAHAHGGEPLAAFPEPHHNYTRPTKHTHTRGVPGPNQETTFCSQESTNPVTLCQLTFPWGAAEARVKESPVFHPVGRRGEDIRFEGTIRLMGNRGKAQGAQKIRIPETPISTTCSWKRQLPFIFIECQLNISSNNQQHGEGRRHFEMQMKQEHGDMANL